MQVLFEFQVYHMIMFNCSFLRQLVPESNESWYLRRTRACLKELKFLLVLLIIQLSIEQTSFEKIENLIRLIFASRITYEL